MITGGFGVSVLLGDDGHPRARHWYVRADGVKRWADNDQPCEQPGGDGMPLCAVGEGGGVLHCDSGQMGCVRVSGWRGEKICTSREYCEHQREHE